MPESPVIDVPHLGILSHVTATQLLERFHRVWGVDPRAVALPLLCPEGIPFENDLDVDPFWIHGKESNSDIGLGSACQAFATHGLDIYLVVEPALLFIGSDTLHVVDIVLDSSRHACIGKAATQELLGSLVRQGIDKAIRAVGDTSKVAGVVLDIGNLWPMGASDGRLELTCFCRSCREFFSRRLGPDYFTRFERHPNPWNLLLKETPTGIEHVAAVKSTSSAQDIVSLSKAKGFAKEFNERQLVREAEELVKYLQTRCEQTEAAIHAVFRAVPQGIDRVLLLEGLPYDWTSGVFFDLVDDPEICSELWFDPTHWDLLSTRVPFRSYMWRRGRYLIDHFFDLRASAANAGILATTGVRRFGQEGLKQMLAARAAETMGLKLQGKIHLNTLPPLKEEPSPGGRIGFVGVALDEELVSDLVTSVVAADVPPFEEQIRQQQRRGAL